jgi:AraC-like DNA-binding protein
LAQGFLRLIRERGHGTLSLPEAAEALGIGRSTLERLSVLWFGVPPGVIIDLERISSVARELGDTEEGLKRIASGHAFDSSSTMGRLFRRFVGLSPRAYRQNSRLRSVREIAHKSRENDH